ncbi:AbrB/MazE/SpoVT family DNA-binding domain-containing protein [Candidatus Woesearchaeota archaeon]|nr:AbrB/MazE/SpoVT family DNA-binding domain-containing protein [Candidatus Woesearchaeota archaeon]
MKGMEVELTTVGERGQAVIPKSIRDQMPAPKGTLFSIVMVDKDTLVFRRVDRKKLLGEFQNLRASVEKLSEAEIVGEIKKR